MKFSSSPRITTGPEDGPEEGEIVSDDLEDISDESIIFTPCNGKSLSRSDHLHALSLSSITEIDEPPVENRRKRKKSYSQKYTRRRKRSRRKPIDSDSSDDDITLDRRLKLQLQAAVRVDVEEAHKNSLRTRLRAMVHGNSGTESENVAAKHRLKENGLNNIVSSSDNALSLREKDTGIIEIESGTDSIISVSEVIPNAPDIIVSATEITHSAPENLQSGSEQSKDDIDSELIQLRIEALKTAINNKFANRKRRKKDITNILSSDDTNKENTNNNNEEQVHKAENTVEIPQLSSQSNNDLKNEPPSPEEDEDVLRALLLASMSKKITSIEPEPMKTTTKIQARPVVVNFNKLTLNNKTGNINNFKLNNLKKVVNSINNVVNKASGNTKLVKIPQVKPLIINVNSDSDSDLDLNSSPEKSPNKLQRNFEKDSNVKLVGNNDAKNLEATIESTVDKFLREQRAKVESEIQIVKAGLEKVTRVMETKKIETTVTNIVSLNNENRLGPTTITTKNAQYATQMTSNTCKIIPNSNRITTSKSPQAVINTPQNSKDLKLANLDKSALKFLPENKREEYKQLQNLLKLRKAQLKKPRIRRTSQKISNNNGKMFLLNKDNLSGDKNGLITKIAPQIINKIASNNKSANTKEPKGIFPNRNPPVTPVISKAKQNKTKTISSKTVHHETTQKIEGTSQLSKSVARNQERRNLQLRVETRNQERKSDALLLHTVLKQMQTRKDGRLQIQERYKSLRPLVKKINDVSKEQKNWDQQVKKLLEQLSEARKKQQEVHQSMSAFVKELAERKQKLDESLAKSNNKTRINLITSTPMKKNISDTTLDISAVDGAVPSTLANLNVADRRADIIIESTLINKNKSTSEQKDHLTKSDESQKLFNTWEQSTKVDNNVDLETPNVKRVVSDTDINVADPNDIDKIIRKTEEKVAVLEKKESFECRRSEKVRYVSPLDSVKRKEDFDPFAIMCPFEVNGMCKDPECTFKHLPK